MSVVLTIVLVIRGHRSEGTTEVEENAPVEGEGWKWLEPAAFVQ